ncbi:hypothetical protein CBLAS_1030 [Campylobacter blaseri]|uniref:DUF4868 domain-containing protein n=1 Tax=Campylobacter blaseri TaxID=2042961 RepID=A0A2P8QYJ2_9BACT|nr:hypothetical protein [Campylobacter blaseri]PSM51316.1 hypothetical protein CQ405_08795 [Campylobacter blaseri]PSM52460.1 hypothetical protein CRN67_08800 [Campylobacter blaseri]QKF86208.1 hypothetical protein CBLAS_1030 [Campylobacter blaseri]
MGSLIAFGKKSYKIKFQEENLNLLKEKNEYFFNATLPDKDCLISFKDNIVYKLEDDEWYFIQYNNSDIINTIYDNFNNYLDLTMLNKEYMKEVDFFIYLAKENNKAIINTQRVYASKILKTRSFMNFFNDSIKYEYFEDVVEIKDSKDLIIDINNKTIYFKKFEILKRLDDNFTEYYKEASKEELEYFQNNLSSNISLFNMKNDFTIGIRNSKKIKYIIDNKILNKFTNKTEELKEYIKTYPMILKDFNANEDFTNLIATNDKQLKHILGILEECYSTTPITKEARVSNSYKKL